MTDIRYELSYNAEGVSITKYDLDANPEPSVEDEWWYTWTEVFMEITNVDDDVPTIV